MERMLGAWELSSRVHSRCHLVSCSETSILLFVGRERGEHKYPGDVLINN